MDPIAFSIGSIDVRWYGVAMAGSMLLGAAIAAALLRKLGRNGDIVWDGLFWVILSGIAGARLVYVFTNLGAYFGEGIPLWKFIAVWEGGLSFHGGIIGGALATWLFFRNREIPLIEIVDAFALGVSPGIILVRIGNFMNGDILGYRWDGPWAMNFPHDSYHPAEETVLRHPTEIYGMLVGLACVVVSALVWRQVYLRKTMLKGSVVAWFAISYSLVRSLIEEPFRVVPLYPKDNPLVDPATAGFGLITTTQIASVFIIIVAIVYLLNLRKLNDRWNMAAAKARKPGSGLSRQARRAAERQTKQN